MRRLFVIASMLATFALLSSAGVANADPTGSETCHGVVGISNPGHVSSQDVWLLPAVWFCNAGQTFSVEIQHTTNGGSSWVDWGREHTKTSGDCNAHYCQETLQWNGTCLNTGSYRAVVYWRGNVDRTSWKGAGQVC